MNTENKIIKFLAYTPFTGLGLYGGFRGNRWLRNRIKVFKQFVIPSLLNQTDQDFVHWISWRPEDRDNTHVIELGRWLDQMNYRYVFTFGGLCFYDDKYEDSEARVRLYNALKATSPVLMDYLGECDEVQMLIQPSDDLYEQHTIQDMKQVFAAQHDVQVLSYQKGYLCNYTTKEILEYNPTTNPPFFCIRFPRNDFFDPNKHMAYTGPYQSHEYVGDGMKLMVLTGRGFLVGTHGENVSTHFNHPFGSPLTVDTHVDPLAVFGIKNVEPLKIPFSFRKWIMRKLPYKWQKLLRYWWGEKIYNFIRN